MKLLIISVLALMRCTTLDVTKGTCLSDGIFEVGVIAVEGETVVGVAIDPALGPMIAEANKGEILKRLKEKQIKEVSCSQQTSALMKALMK